MTIRTAFETGCKILEQLKIETPVLDTTVLLAEALHISKEKLYASFPEEIDEAAYERYKKFIDLRRTGIPVSYIRRKKEFYGLEFMVDTRVLVPRPETETLVEAVLSLVNARKCWAQPLSLELHDTCTGSGAIAITLKHLLPWLHVSASDLSAEAGQVFALNSERILGCVLPFTVSNLLAGVTGPFDIITANPPYLTHEQACLMKARGWPEPALALDGGEDGLSIVRQLLPQAKAALKPGGVLVLEADAEQMPAIAGLFTSHAYGDIHIEKDLGGLERVIYGSKKDG